MAAGGGESSVLPCGTVLTYVPDYTTPLSALVFRGISHVIRRASAIFSTRDGCTGVTTSVAILQEAFNRLTSTQPTEEELKAQASAAAAAAAAAAKPAAAPKKVCAQRAVLLPQLRA